MYIGNLIKNTHALNNKDLLAYSNILADTLYELIKIVSDKNYVIFYGNDYIFLFDEEHIGKINSIRGVADIISLEGILIYNNNLIILNNNKLKYIDAFIKYLEKTCISLESDEMKSLLYNFVEINYGKVKTRTRK